nr:hypothetical protein [Tanacetum cinerariifolium]
MDKLPCSTQYFKANNLLRSEFTVTLIRKFIEIAVVVKKRPHDYQDLPNDHEGEKIKKRRKDAGEHSFRSSKTDKVPMDSIQEHTHADQPKTKKKNVFRNILMQDGLLRSRGQQRSLRGNQTGLTCS